MCVVWVGMVVTRVGCDVCPCDPCDRVCPVCPLCVPAPPGIPACARVSRGPVCPVHMCVPAPPGVTGHFFRKVAGQLNGQLLRFVATRNQK